MQQILNRRVQQRGILQELRHRATLIHVRSALQEPLNIDPDQARRNQAYRRQHTEAPADPIGNDERLVAFAAHDLAQHARFDIGRDDQMLLVLVAQELHELLAEQHELAHGLGRAAGLRDHVEERLGRVDVVQELPHELGVHVVEHEQARRSRRRREVVVRAVERRLQRGVAERGTSDAEHADVLEAPPNRRRVLQNLRLHIIGVGQIQPAQILCATRLNRRQGGRRAVLQAEQLGFAQAVLGADGIGHDVRVVEANCAHGRTPGGVTRTPGSGGAERKRRPHLPQGEPREPCAFSAGRSSSA